MQSIAAIIKPPVQDVVQFLKEHIHHDIRCIARSTGNNDDEAAQVIHLVLVGIVNSLGQPGGTFNIKRKFKPFTDIKKVNEISVKSQPFLCKLQYL